MESFRLKLLAARIELLWWFIRRERQKGNKLLESGFSHSSQKLLALNQRYSKHCAQVMKAQQEYGRKAKTWKHTQEYSECGEISGISSTTQTANYTYI